MKGKLLSDAVEVVALSRENGTLNIKVEGSSGNDANFKIKAPLDKGSYTLSDHGLLFLILPEAGVDLEAIKKIVTDGLKIK